MAYNNSFLNTTATAIVNMAWTTTLHIIANNTSATGTGEAKISTISKIRVSIYAVCLFLGIIGNSVVVVTSCRQEKTPRLRFLLAHLAVTDILFCLRLPIQIQLELNGHRWNYGAVMCKLFNYVNSMAMLASIGTMAIIAVERYRGITKGLLARITKTKILLSIAFVWFVSILTYAPVLYARKILNHRCHEIWLNKRLQKAFSVITVFVKYILPLSVIGFCYYKVVRVIRNRPILAFLRGERKNSQQRRRERSDNRVIIMLIVMVVAFAVLTLPASIWWILFDFGGLKPTDGSMEVIEACGALVYFHSCVNPIVYFIMDGNFRADVKKLFACSLLECQLPRVDKVDLKPRKMRTNSISLTVIP